MTMTETGQKSVTIKNVFVGEVWLCSGKSSIADVFIIENVSSLRRPLCGRGIPLESRPWLL